VLSAGRRAEPTQRDAVWQVSFTSREFYWVFTAAASASNVPGKYETFW
jgi:hypothetical protein